MNNDNKNRILMGLRMLALVIWLVLVIITCAGVWNFDKEEGFVRWCAFLLMAVNLCAIGYLFVKFRKEDRANSKALQQQGQGEEK